MGYPRKKRMYNQQYAKDNCVQVGLCLNKKTDADIIAFLESCDNKQGTIKKAIRKLIVDMV